MCTLHCGPDANPWQANYTTAPIPLGLFGPTVASAINCALDPSTKPTIIHNLLEEKTNLWGEEEEEERINGQTHP